MWRGKFAVLDVFNKITVAILTADQRAITEVKVLDKEWIHQYGVQAQIHSDQGQCLKTVSKCYDWISPFFLMFDRSLHLPIDHLLSGGTMEKREEGMVETWVTKHPQKLQQAYRLTWRQRRQGAVKDASLNPGELVYLRN